MFMESYAVVDHGVRRKMEEMLNTWKGPVPGSIDSRPVFPPEIVGSIENALFASRASAAQRLGAKAPPGAHRDMATPPVRQRSATPQQQQQQQQHPYAQPQPQPQPPPPHAFPTGPYRGGSLPPPGPPPGAADGPGIDTLNSDIENLLVALQARQSIEASLQVSVQLAALGQLKELVQRRDLSPEQLAQVRTQVAQMSVNVPRHAAPPAAHAPPVLPPPPPPPPNYYGHISVPVPQPDHMTHPTHASHPLAYPPAAPAHHAPPPPPPPQPAAVPTSIDALLGQGALAALLAAKATPPARPPYAVPPHAPPPVPVPTPIQQPSPGAPRDPLALLAELRKAGIVAPTSASASAPPAPVPVGPPPAVPMPSAAAAAAAPNPLQLMEQFRRAGMLPPTSVAPNTLSPPPQQPPPPQGLPNPADLARILGLASALPNAKPQHVSPSPLARALKQQQ
jgi:pre-mRNA cleavage complex 2 protein Pcf11